MLGSDLYAGFFGADQHFFITLPLQHVLEALSFRAFGSGLAQARGVSVVAGVAVVWIVGWLAYRWYGLAAALVCEVLLVAWPSNITAASNGLPLLGWRGLRATTCWRSRSAGSRFWRWILRWRDRAWCGPLLLGLACGVAALTQFMGVFVTPVVFAVWLLAGARPCGSCVDGAGHRGDRAAVGGLCRAACAGRGWAGDGLRRRGDFLRPAFYVENVLMESGRYEHLFGDRSFSVLLLTVGLWPALAYVVWRSRDRTLGRRSDRVDELRRVRGAAAGARPRQVVGVRGGAGAVGVPGAEPRRHGLDRLGLAHQPAAVDATAGRGARRAFFVRAALDGVAAYQLTLAQAEHGQPV